MTTVKEFIFTGGNFHRFSTKPAKLDPARCSFSVAEYGRVTDWHQCERAVVEEVDGYGFCTVHAREVKRRLGKEQETFVRYVASFKNGKPFLAELDVVRETEKTIDISGIRKLIGDDMLFTGNQRKDSRYTNCYKFFDTVDEGLGWLSKEALERVNYLAKELGRAKVVYEDLQG